MSDHEFERRVRQELNDLKITPSGSSWVRIEEELSQRPRKRPLLWVPLVVLGLAGAGYFIFDKPSGQQVSPVTSTASTRSKTKTAARPAETGLIAGEKAIGNEKNIKDQTDGSNSLPEAAPPEAGHTGGSSGDAGTRGNQPLAGQSDQTKANLNSKTRVSSKERFTQLSKPSERQISLLKRGHQQIEKSSSAQLTSGNRHDDENALSDAVVEDMLSSSENVNPGIAKVRPAIESNMSPRFNMTTLNNYQLSAIGDEVGSLSGSAYPTLFGPATAAPSKGSFVKKSKWSYALTASAGSTMIGEGSLDFKNSSIQDVSQQALQPNYAPTGPTPGPYKPSSIRPGLGYSVGGVVQRRLSNRFSVSAGLNYTRLTTFSKVGERVNEPIPVTNSVSGPIVVTSFFRFQDNVPKEYVNKYHFIELPVTLHTKLINSRTLPLYWNAGFSLSRLLTSNSLLFDGNNGVYYRDKNLLNQTQAALSTGFSVAVFNRSRHPLMIGPSLKYHLTTILKKDVSGNKHLMYLGMDLKWFLKK